MTTDGRRNNGGARDGAGRKPAKTEAELRRRLSKWTATARDRAFARLFQDAESDVVRTRHAAMKLLMSYEYGKPAQRVIIESDPGDGQKRVVDLSQLKNEELEILERAGEILARARGGQGGEGKA